MKTLLIDDIRNMDVTHIARTYNEGIQALIYDGPFDVLYLDHDLGCFDGDQEQTGYTVMCWLEANPQYLPERIELVTANPVGRVRMEAVIQKLYRYY